MNLEQRVLVKIFLPNLMIKLLHSRLKAKMLKEIGSNAVRGLFDEF